MAAEEDEAAGLHLLWWADVAKRKPLRSAYRSAQTRPFHRFSRKNFARFADFIRIIDMRPRVCICCGEPMSERGGAFSRNPNMCASCSSMADGMGDETESGPPPIDAKEEIEEPALETEHQGI